MSYNKLLIWLNFIAGLTENEILAQAILFLLAGYETTAATLSFVAYNLALYPECQEQLYNEVDSVVGNQVWGMHASDELTKLNNNDAMQDIDVVQSSL